MEMSIGLLRESNQLSPRQEELLQTAYEELRRLQALVNDLLDLSKIEAGRLVLEFKPVDVNTLVAGALEPFAAQAEKQGVTLHNEVSADMGQVSADANKIVWVLTNLIGNALRYSPSDGQVTVSASGGKDAIYISVADDGPGIPPEYQSKIFDKFVQVNGSQSGGTGLGLAISREFVRSHGGTIWVESEPGQGSTFTFTLPRIQTETER
jgi:NtrC-family two-component system sensor histidine kinase KinB